MLRSTINLSSVGLSSLALILTGCAGVLNPVGETTFSCPNTNGVTCKTPMQVYEMTHGALPLDGRSGLSSTNNQQVKTNQSAIVSVQQGGTTTTVNTATSLLPQSPMPPQLLQAVNGAPAPLLEPARVMRVWIAPWIDNKQHLHWPSYVYAEVQPRRWTMGVPDFTQMRSGLPLISRQTPATQAVNHGAGAAQLTAPTNSAGQAPPMPGSSVPEAAPAASGASQ